MIRILLERAFAGQLGFEMPSGAHVFETGPIERQDAIRFWFSLRIFAGSVALAMFHRLVPDQSGIASR
jgi:hypothetical protein